MSCLQLIGTKQRVPNYFLFFVSFFFSFSIFLFFCFFVFCFCLSQTLLLFLFSYFVIIKMILIPWYGFSYHMVFFSLTCLLGVISHCRCQFSNPGTIPKQPHQGPRVPAGVKPSHIRDLPTVCSKCKTLKPETTHHCRLCGHCVIRMDHHCPWVNNCVAMFNQKYFILFLVYTGVSAFYAAILLTARFLSCTSSAHRVTFFFFYFFFFFFLLVLLLTYLLTFLLLFLFYDMIWL